MATLPESDADVYYGDADKPLPDWREVAGDDSDDDDTLTADERAAVIGVLGFDPADIVGAEGGEGDQPVTFLRR